MSRHSGWLTYPSGARPLRPVVSAQLNDRCRAGSRRLGVRHLNGRLYGWDGVIGFVLQQ